MSMSESKRAIYRELAKCFRRSGLNLERDAANLVAEFAEVFGEDIPTLVDELLSSIRNSGVLSKTSVVPLSVIQPILKTMEQPEAYEADTISENPSIAVVSAFTGSGASDKPLHAEAIHKSARLTQRGKLIRERLLRDRAFCPPSNHALIAQKHEYYRLTPLDSVLGTQGVQFVFGMLAELEDGQFSLEDVDSCSGVSVPIDLSACSSTRGLFTEHCFVLAEGVMDERGCFQVTTLGQPIIERREDTLLACPSLNFCTPSEHESLKAQEEARDAQSIPDVFVILSEVYLDSPVVMEGLDRILSGYADSAPAMIVLMGNFTSRKYGSQPGDLRRLEDYFDELSAMIQKYKGLLRETHFVLVPGPDDIGFGQVLPRPPLPKLVTKNLRQKIPHLTMASNPCRVRYYTQEIVLFREDFMHKMRRNCILTPTFQEGETLSQHLVTTVLSQGHLLPLPLQIQPVYWAHDDALCLQPCPSAIVLADREAQFDVSMEDCTAFNPGSFASDGTFVVYSPADKAVDFSTL